MKTIKIDSFSIIGISVLTSNVKGQSGTDIPNLWKNFMNNNKISQIPNRLSDEIYCIYTNYESDQFGAYTTLLGCKVSNLDEIPNGFIGMTFGDGKYEKMQAQGDITDGSVIWNAWEAIWKKDLNRAFIADFEVYGEKSANPKDAEVDIFVSVRN